MSQGRTLLYEEHDDGTASLQAAITLVEILGAVNRAQQDRPQSTFLSAGHGVAGHTAGGRKQPRPFMPTRLLISPSTQRHLGTETSYSSSSLLQPHQG